MPHPNLLDSSRAALVVIDIQEAFRSVVPDFALIASRASTAVRGFQLLEVPVIVTEQYPKGLGRTAEEIQLMLAENTEVYEKTAFSSCGAVQFEKKLKKLGESTPFKRPGQPVELAPVYVLLASQEASYTTGEIYGVTGGMGIA